MPVHVRSVVVRGGLVSDSHLRLAGLFDADEIHVVANGGVDREEVDASVVSLSLVSGDLRPDFASAAPARPRSCGPSSGPSRTLRSETSGGGVFRWTSRPLARIVSTNNGRRRSQDSNLGPPR